MVSRSPGAIVGVMGMVVMGSVTAWYVPALSFRHGRFPPPWTWDAGRRGARAGHRRRLVGRGDRPTLDVDGSFVIAYRVRAGHAGRGSTVVARSPDGEHLTTVATLDQSRFDAGSMERPAVVRTDDGRWRLYVCSASKPPSKHWWIDLLEADDPADFADAEARTVFPGDASTGVKDPIVRRAADGGWEASICCHPLDVPDEEDRMTTGLATSPDGLRLDLAWHGASATAGDVGPAGSAADRDPSGRARGVRRAREQGGTGGSAPDSPA